MSEERVKVSITLPKSQVLWLKKQKIYRISHIAELAIARLIEKSR